MTETPSFRDLLVTRPERPFAYLDPPFAYNSPAINAYPKELTGYYHLEVMRRRLGWASYAGKVMLDFGCGVRFTRTIHNLDLSIGLYIGVDVNRPVIDWFKANVSDPRFRFEHLNTPNTFYNAQAPALSAEALAALGLPECDLISMFSVITHQNPGEAALTLAQTRRVIKREGRLYFTAFIDEAQSGFTEKDPAQPGLMATYEPELPLRIVREAGWRPLSAFPRSELLQAAFVCVPA